VTDKALDKLAVLGALAANWLDTTHGNELGHDHHCAERNPPGNEARTSGDPDRCSCGWATFYAAYLALYPAEPASR
jgi:hypothetical protein